MKVLVVDDNKDTAETIQIFLELAGYEVQVAHSAQDGLEKASVFRPRAVVSDIGMHGLDGHYFAKALRQHQPLKYVVLIAISGYTTERDIARVYETGFDLFLAKPVDLQKIVEELRARLSTAI